MRMFETAASTMLAIAAQALVVKFGEQALGVGRHGGGGKGSHGAILDQVCPPPAHRAQAGTASRWVGARRSRLR